MIKVEGQRLEIGSRRGRCRWTFEQLLLRGRGESDYLSRMKDNLTPISTEDAARILDVSEQRVRELCRSGVLGAFQIGKNWGMEKSVVEAYGKTTGMIAAEDSVAKVRRSDQERPVALSFFSGAMGLDLGLETAGFDVRLACEIDRFCRQTISPFASA